MLSSREKKTLSLKLALFKGIGTVLKNHGHSKLSINLVAETSGVDKTFIYRHFTDFNGLLKAYVEQYDFWIRGLEDMTSREIDNHREFMKELLTKQFTEVYKNGELQQFLVWELGDKEGFTTKVAIEREIMAEKIFEQCKNVFDRYRIDLNMIYATLSAGIYYLILHKDKSTFCDFDFTTEHDTSEFLKTLHWIIDVLFDKLDVDCKLERAVIRAHKKGISIDDIVEIMELPKNKVNRLVHSY